jgi:putative transposase
MSHAASTSTGQVYGVARVCRVGGIPRSTVYARRQAIQAPRAPQRRGPRTRWSDDDLVGHIRAVLEADAFVGEGYRKVWARLRIAGVRTSKRRTLRLMRENDLLAPSRARLPQELMKTHDGTITTTLPDEMWGTDITGTLTRHEGLVNVFVLVDHCTSECLGLHAAVRATRFEAIEPLHQAIRDIFGAYAPACAAGLKLRHDHGSQFMSEHYQAELRFLGIESSPAFVREPEGNGCAERFIRTLKEQLLRIQTFDTLAELQAALDAFRLRYNTGWLVEKHAFKTPAATRLALSAGYPEAA